MICGYIVVGVLIVFCLALWVLMGVIMAEMINDQFNPPLWLTRLILVSGFIGTLLCMTYLLVDTVIESAVDAWRGKL